MIIRIAKIKMYDTSISLPKHILAEIKSVTGLDNKLEDFHITPHGSDDLYQDFYIELLEQENNKDADDPAWVLQGGERIHYAGKREPSNIIFKTKNNTLVSLIDGKISFTETPDLNTFVKANACIEVVSTLYELSKTWNHFKPLLQESIMLAEQLYGLSVDRNKPIEPLNKELSDVVRKGYSEIQQQAEKNKNDFNQNFNRILRELNAKKDM